MRLDSLIIFENDQLVAVNKPSGMLTIPDRHNVELPALSKYMKARYESVFIVHRLDRDTSGIVLFAKDEQTHRYLSELFLQRQVAKFYLGIIGGQLPKDSGTVELGIMDHPVVKGKMVGHAKGKPSKTDYQVLEAFPQFSLVKLQIHTGRTHQIRVHMKSLGHPIAVDPLYGSDQPIYLSSIKKKYKLGRNVESETPILNRLALHAYQLKFNLSDGTRIELEAPLPKDISALLQQLRKQQKG
jgi:23S rRNA pseudouridine1911/1915/1917 synthase